MLWPACSCLAVSCCCLAASCSSCCCAATSCCCLAASSPCGGAGADAFRQFFQLPAHIRRNDGRGCDRGWRGCHGDVVGLEVSLPGERASGADQGCHGKSRQCENAVAEFRSVIDDLNVFETGRPRKHADGWLWCLRPAGIAGVLRLHSCCFERRRRLAR